MQELINTEEVDVNAKDKYGEAALIWASQYGNKDIVALLLQHEANVNVANDQDYTALMNATGNGHKDIVELLLKARAIINTQNQYGHTALIYASQAGHKDIVGLLLKYGADVTIKNNKGETALDKAKEMSTTKWLSQKQKARYRKIGRMLLEAYIKEKKLRGAQAAAARAIEKTHALPPEISKYFAS